MAEAFKNGPLIPQITFFGCEIVFNSIPSPPEIVSLIQVLQISFSRFKHFQFHVVDYPPSGKGKLGGGVFYYMQLEGNLLCEIRSA